MANDRLAHVVCNCKYHIVILPKYRYKMFTREVKEYIKNEIKKLCTWLRIEILEGKICKDHVHLCLSIPSKYAVSDIIGTLKGKTAIRLFNKFPDLRKKYWGCHFWSRGYYVDTVGRNEEIIRQYIRNQDELDRKGNQRSLFN